MKTWNAKARWLRGNYGSTNRQKELKPDFMTIVVEDAESQLPRGTQRSRRYIYCFLHCGSMMQLLHFDRSGLMASEILDIKRHTDKFIRCLLGVFRHAPSRLGYPAGKEAPFHKYGPDNRLLQVVTVDSRQLYCGRVDPTPSKVC